MASLPRLLALTFSLGSALAAGCSSSSNPASTGTGGHSGTVGGSGGTAIMTDGGGASLPLIVDDHTGPGSCYGKAAVAGAVDQTPDAPACLTLAPTHTGKCWTIGYHPTGGTDSFGGCQWSLDPNATAALTIQPGATKATFMAAGAAGGETINFFAGGTPSDRASFVATKITLTTTLTSYDIPIPDLTSDTQIHVPFGYTIIDGDNASSTLSFSVTDIEWVQN